MQPRSDISASNRRLSLVFRAWVVLCFAWPVLGLMGVRPADARSNSTGVEDCVKRAPRQAPSDADDSGAAVVAGETQEEEEARRNASHSVPLPVVAYAPASMRHVGRLAHELEELTCAQRRGELHNRGPPTA